MATPNMIVVTTVPGATKVQVRCTGCGVILDKPVPLLPWWQILDLVVAHRAAGCPRQPRPTPSEEPRA